MNAGGFCHEPLLASLRGKAMYETGRQRMSERIEIRRPRSPLDRCAQLAVGARIFMYGDAGSSRTTSPQTHRVSDPVAARGTLMTCSFPTGHRGRHRPLDLEAPPGETYSSIAPLSRRTERRSHPSSPERPHNHGYNKQKHDSCSEGRRVYVCVLVTP